MVSIVVITSSIHMQLFVYKLAVRVVVIIVMSFLLCNIQHLSSQLCFVCFSAVLLRVPNIFNNQYGTNFLVVVHENYSNVTHTHTHIHTHTHTMFADNLLQVSLAVLHVFQKLGMHC